jgi:hypothetical protein
MLWRIGDSAGKGGIRGLRPQRAGIQRQTESQQEEGNFVHKVDLERSGSPRFCQFNPVSATITDAFFPAEWCVGLFSLAASVFTRARW